MTVDIAKKVQEEQTCRVITWRAIGGIAICH